MSLNQAPQAPKVTNTRDELYYIEQRIHNKILLLTFKALNGLAPQYLSCLLQPYSVQAYALRSNDYKKTCSTKS